MISQGMLDDIQRNHYAGEVAWELAQEVKRLRTLLGEDGVLALARERQRQVEREGFDAKHDDEHDVGVLALAAVCYALPPPLEARVRVAGSDRAGEDPWPWAHEHDKRALHTYRRRLEIAGALIAAEWDRLARAKAALGFPS